MIKIRSTLFKYRVRLGWVSRIIIYDQFFFGAVPIHLNLQIKDSGSI